MESLTQEIDRIVTDCLARPAGEQAGYAAHAFDALLAECTLNPTGDDPVTVPGIPAPSIAIPANIQPLFDDFKSRYILLEKARPMLAPDSRQILADAIHTLADGACLHEHLEDKFHIPENRVFLDKALHNAVTPWQMALVAYWALNEQGIDKLAGTAWHTCFPELDLVALIPELISKITFEYTPTLRAYRREGMHHYPRISPEEFQALAGDDWRAVVDLPSGRPTHQDVPFITPFIKQGDIEHSLYRHFLMPDLLQFMREATPAISDEFRFADTDRNLLYGLPFVIRQVEEELFGQVKQAISEVIKQWAQALEHIPTSDAAIALTITRKIWDYRRSPAAQDCQTPVDNLIKGFTATIRNGFGHITDVNLAAGCGSRVDPLDVSEKLVLFASVSNGQLDNLAEAHRAYLTSLTNPADWNNETFFSQFLAVNRRMDPHHIQAHFVVDKTRGCPAVPQIARFHGIVFDLVLGFALHEFGEENLRQAGDWFIRDQVPADSI